MDDQSEIPERSKVQIGIEDLVSVRGNYDWSGRGGFALRYEESIFGLMHSLVVMDVHDGRKQSPGAKFYGHLFRMVNCIERTGRSIYDLDGADFNAVYSDPMAECSIPSRLIH